MGILKTKMREYEELPCGCLVSEDSGDWVIPCYHEERDKNKLHYECIKAHHYGFTAKEIKKLYKTKKLHNLRSHFIKICPICLAIFSIKEANNSCYTCTHDKLMIVEIKNTSFNNKGEIELSGVEFRSNKRNNRQLEK